MSKKDKIHPTKSTAEDKAEEALAPETNLEKETAAEAIMILADLEKKLAEAEAHADEYKDGWQRSVADFQNYRKRVEAEKVETYQNAVGSIIKQYLPILDDLERALATRPANLPWVEGIELIYRKLQFILEAEGLKRIEAEGQQFDPNFHEAIQQEPCDGYESGQVIEVIRNGYLLGERVIRPAMVRVAK
jgi:molecular chaperone GrpE